MDCQRWRELASDYIEGTLTGPALAAMREHTEACAKCQREEEVLRAMCRELNVLPQVDPPLFFRENVIAAIEREQKAQAKPWWNPAGIKHWALGTTFVGATCALFAVAYLNDVSNRKPDETGNRPVRANVLPSSPSGLLPGTENERATGNVPAPRLRVSRATTIYAGRGPAYSFSFWLENAERGTMRIRLNNDRNSERQDQRLHLFGTNPETLIAPFDVVPTPEDAPAPPMDLQLLWTANNRSHERRLLVPVAQPGDSLPEARQSFGLPEGDIASAGREIAARYGRPVTLDDVPADLRVQLVARDETALNTLRRHLEPLGLRVSESKAGLLIEGGQTAGQTKPTE